jgi:hypothetical protein
MATLTTLQNFIDNIKQTPSGKVEWSDVSLKGLEEEVLNLFSTNAFQSAANVINLQTLSGADSQLAVVENDPTLAKNGIYFWSTSPVVVGYTYPATGGGFWNFVRNPTTSPVTQITAGTNVTISPVGGTGNVTINSQSTAINATNFFVPTRLNSTTFVNSNIYDNTNITKTATSGFSFDYTAQQYLFGDYTNGGNATALFIDDSLNRIQTTKQSLGLGLSVDYLSNTYQLGDYGNILNGTNISLNDTANTIAIIANASTNARIDIDGVSQISNFRNNVHRIGGDTNRTFLNITDSSSVIYTEYANNPLGLTLSMANRRFTLGDTGSNNGAKLFIDDVASTVLLSTSTSNATSLRMTDAGSAIRLNCSNLEINASLNLAINGTTTTTTYTSIPRFLEVQVNGIICYIPLYQ